jgi:hypothetical protein
VAYENLERFFQKKMTNTNPVLEDLIDIETKKREEAIQAL